MSAKTVEPMKTTPRIPEDILSRSQKVMLHLSCLEERRRRGTLGPTQCSFFWAGIGRELPRKAFSVGNPS